MKQSVFVFGVLAGSVLIACTGGPGDISGKGINDPVGGGSQRSGQTASGKEDDNDNGNGNTGGQDSGSTSTPPQQTLVCGKTMCQGTQFCVYQSCVTDGGDMPSACVDEAPSGCTNASSSPRVYVCPCE